MDKRACAVERWWASHAGLWKGARHARRSGGELSTSIHTLAGIYPQLIPWLSPIHIVTIHRWKSGPTAQYPRPHARGERCGKGGLSPYPQPLLSTTVNLFIIKDLRKRKREHPQDEITCQRALLRHRVIPKVLHVSTAHASRPSSTAHVLAVPSIAHHPIPLLMDTLPRHA